MNNYSQYLPLLKISLQKLDNWRDGYGADHQTDFIEHLEKSSIQSVLDELAEKLQGNYPFHHPQYAGQMLKPPHPVAWLAYSLAMTINPNNHALDGGPPTSEMEKEVVNLIAAMAGYENNYLGHLTSGGTIANLEALFIAREIHPDKSIAATANAHYTHKRMCRILNCNFLEIPVDQHGIPDLSFIETHAEEIGTLVVTLGTTGLGIIEPLDELMNLSHKYGFRVHADAAYGGFFKLIENELPSEKHWKKLSECDSVVIDPHKHGLQPYGCGAILFKDASVGKYYKHDSPYTYFTSDDLHLGEISIECSRAGAAAAALWATLQMLPLTSNGLGEILRKTRSAAVTFAGLLQNRPDWQLYNTPELDITGYFKVPESGTISELNKQSKHIFSAGMKNRDTGFHLSLFKVKAEDFVKKFPDYRADVPEAVLLRSVFMKEEHEGFVEELTDRIFSA